jgi:acyl dehydratase
MTKTGAGNFFEDFRLGQTIRHATPRTLTAGDVALYTGLFGGRFAVQTRSPTWAMPAASFSRRCFPVTR